MKISVFVNWKKEKIVNADEMEKVISDRAQEIIDDEYELVEYLEDISRIEIFNMSDKEKKELLEKFKVWARERAIQIYLTHEWEEVGLEV